jgi:ABC-type glycerol-3-phosphate transport system permease component
MATDKRLLDASTRLSVHVLLLLAAAVTALPFVWMLCAAFKGSFEHLFLPRGDGFLGIAWDQLSLNNFRRLFTEVPFANAILNSVFIASVSAVTSTAFACAAGFALAKYSFKGRSFVISVVLAALLIPGPLLIAPGYQLLYDLGLLNTYTGLILPGMVPAFGVFLFRQAMVNSVPDELLESARIDGAGELRLFLQIVVPVVRPMLGAYLLISFLGSWNNFIGPQIVLQDDVRHPLSVALASLRGVYGTDFGLVMSGTLVSIAPVMALFLLLQREFIQGLTSGAVKG